MSVTIVEDIDRTKSAWGAVLSMTLCVFVLIASEFMPVSLLTPIAADLGVTEGQTGQAISISGVFAVITSLFIATATRRLDRKVVVVGLTALLAVSGIIVTFAPTYIVLMIGRAMLGISIGGFWSMSTAIVMRLVSESQVPSALATLNAGNAIAATISAPLGSLLGAYVGWRGAFFLVVPVAVLAVVWQFVSLPALPPRHAQSSPNVFRLLRRPLVVIGMTAILLLFMGQFALFTYLRPFLEHVTHLSIGTLSLILLVMGLAGAAGTWLIGRLLAHRLFSILAAIPMVMAGLALFLIVFGASELPVLAALVGWGFFGTAAPVGWGTWLSRYLADDAEAGGGLQVAVIQLAITAGASIGGMLFDAIGWWSAFAFAAILLVASSLASIAAWRTTRRPS
ncbi:MFS transporter [Agrobacterium pusense]|uniref:MFS transporter n=1 Tax=Agrobacterium pusense TaxID=648995 RepID=UPI003FD6ACF1